MSIRLFVQEVVQKTCPHLAVEWEFSLARHTTVGIGGNAVALFPSTVEESVQLLSLLHKEKVAYSFLGAGANTLPDDGEFSRLIVSFSRLKFAFAHRETLFLGAGTTGGALCKIATQARLSGVEFCTGIPMTLGGGIAMNAGVQDVHFCNVVEHVLAIKEGKLCTISASECQFSTKNSVFLQENIAILGARLRLAYSDEEKIARETCYFTNRRAHLPKGKSMGCTFVNPEQGSAGKLIEDCALKGVSIGGAKVSAEHANFFLNEGATADEMKQLIAYVKRRVKEQTGITLREEIRYLPSK